MTLPIYFDKNGIEPRSPLDIRSNLIERVQAINPGYTANMPGMLIEDILSTNTLSIAMMEQGRIEAVNCLTPLASNAYTLGQLGQIYGVQLNAPSRTSVYVDFTGIPGYVIATGFTVSDGSYQYAVRDSGVIQSSGTVSLYCVATVDNPSKSNQGWPVPSGTVTQIITSVPSAYTVTCTNSQPGIPGFGQESEESYRARVLQAGLAYQQGSIAYLKTQLLKISGVQSRLISVRVIRQRISAMTKEIIDVDEKIATISSLQVIVGGGDPYEVAHAILNSLFDIYRCQGSDVPERTISVNIIDGSDVYEIKFVSPFAQTLGVELIWNTSGTQIIANEAAIKVSLQPMIDFINSTTVGHPLNVYMLQGIFQNALGKSMPPELVTKIDFSFKIDGNPVQVTNNTGLLPSDPEGYFIVEDSNFIIRQG